MPNDNTPLLQVSQLCKQFPGVRALHNVDLTLGRGEVLALIGENGAGKSTLMKILAGIQPPDSGEILLDGQHVQIDSVNSAMDLGITLIHQELNLADNLSVDANIYLGREPKMFGLIDDERIMRDSARYLSEVGLSVSPGQLVKELTIGKQQLVEIAKALSTKTRILIMDEPTSSLSQKETETLFDVVKQLRDDGVSVIYISHRLREVTELADRVTVLRDGENAGDLEKSQIDHNAMVSLMVGRDISQFYARKQHDLGDVVLKVDDLIVPENPGHQLSFSLNAGEIVGVSGLVGAGRTEMLQCLFGASQPLGGTIEIDGKSVNLRSPSDAIEAGLALVPEDRKQQGLVIDMSVRHNASLAGLQRNQKPGGFINDDAESQDVSKAIRDLNIKTPSADQIARYLSGGNQQKVVIGKWLSLGPKVLLLDEPTRGIDVGAKEEIYTLMEQLAQKGMAVLFVSSELEEIIGMSDRALVMHEGKITGELSRAELTEEAIMHLATGQQLQAAN